MDAAILRRMNAKLHIALPDRDARRTMMEGWLRKDKVTCAQDAIEVLLNKTEGYSGDFLKKVAAAAKAAAARGGRPISAQDFEAVCGRVKSGVTKEAVVENESFAKEQGDDWLSS